MRRAAAVDANQSEIVGALRGVGASVELLHAVGQGCPDIAVGFRGRNWFIEIKDGSKPPSARKLTEAQVKWHGEWRGQVDVAHTVDHALQIIGVQSYRDLRDRIAEEDAE